MARDKHPTRAILNSKNYFILDCVTIHIQDTRCAFLYIDATFIQNVTGDIINLCQMSPTY